MKRADQHPVRPNATTAESELNKPEQTGLVRSAEEEFPMPEKQHADLGALPIDTPGSRKEASSWKSTAGDERHEANTSAQVDSSEIVKNGAGPDPEHMD